MSDAWDEKRKAQEESYFDNLNQQALSRLKSRTGEKARLSPITGKPMEQVQISGVIVDRCVDSGGIFLDAGELEQILEYSKKNQSGFTEFFSKLLK